MSSTDPADFKASSALEVDQDRTLDHLERGLPVRLIGTFDNLTTTHLEEPVAVAIEKARDLRFDFLPVCEAPGSAFIGLLSVNKARTSNASKVAEVSDRLSSQNLIAAETPLLHFVYEADNHPCRMILDGARITGLVTISDLQKLPVRIALFSLFIHLEILLTEFLRDRLGPANPFDSLSPTRADKAKGKWEQFKRGDVDQDRLHVLDFCDKRTLLRKMGFGDLPPSRIEAEFKTIEEKLRNPIAHGAEYLHSQKAAIQLASTVRLMRDWIDRLRQEMAKGAMSSAESL